MLRHGGKHTGTKQAAPATNTRATLVDIPLPSRRPATLRTQNHDHDHDHDSVLSHIFGD